MSQSANEQAAPPPSPFSAAPRVRITATAAERERLKAYLREGSADRAAKAAGCCERTIRRTWQRFSPMLAELVDSIPSA